MSYSPSSSPPPSPPPRVSRSLTAANGGAVGATASNFTVAVSATITIAGVEVPINSGPLGGSGQTNINFNLSQPVVLGTLEDFFTWAEGELGLTNLKTPEQYVDMIPVPAIKSALDALLNLKFTITSLSVNYTGAGSQGTPSSVAYSFGVTVSSGSPPLALGPISLNQIGLQIAGTS
ncbi:MAG: hypothetical protein JNK48_17565 [Bryobacterales bacterium]|nr:hypothetical protein [Bryobacterales bacterium]